MAEALKQIHATPASLVADHGDALTLAFQTICQAVKTTCVVDVVQLWLIEDAAGQAQDARWLKLRACSEGCAETAAPGIIDLANDSVLSRVLREGCGYALNALAGEVPGSLVSTRFAGAASVLLVPLLVNGQALGLLALLHRRAPEHFTAEAVALAELLAGHVALAVQNALLFAAAQARAFDYERGLRAVARTSEAVTSTLRLSEVSEQIVSVVCSLLAAQSAWLMVYDEEADLLRLAAVCGWDAVRGATLEPGKSVTGEVLLTGRPMFVPDVQADPRFAVKREAAEAGIIAMLGLPLMAQGQVVGVLGVNPAPGPDGRVRNPLEGPDADWLRLFAGQAGVAVQNALLYERLQAEHVLAEQLAHASQRHAEEMETIFESMAEGVAVFDTNGQLVRLNRAGAALAGVSAAKLLTVSSMALGTGMSERVAGKEFGLIGHPLVMRALAGKVVRDEELAMTRADGAQVTLQISVAPLYGEKGQVTGAVAIMEDVTEQREYQRGQLAVGWVAAALNHPLDLKETLDTAVEALTAALGADDSAIMLADEQAGVLRIASERGYGVGTNFPTLPMDAPLAPCVAFRTHKVLFSDSGVGAAVESHPFLQELAQKSIQAWLVVPLLVQDQALGVLVYAYSHPHRFSANEQQVARAIADQIALAVENARLYEEVADYLAWQENERQTLQAIIDTLPAGVVLRDKDGKLFMYNEAALKLACNYAELQAAREVGQAPVEPVWDIVRADGAPVEAGSFPSQLVVQTGEPVKELQLFLRQQDGRVVPVLLNAVPVQDADGNFTLGLSVFQDITALKELERHKDEFISVASHELRGPLTVIRGQAQLLQRQVRRQQKQGELPPALLHIMESMESIEVQTARLNDLVNDLLDVSRIQAGKLTLQRGKTPLMPLLMKAVQHWQAASDRHPLTLETDLPPEGVIGNWDARRVEQIINNLIGNALKYSPEGGQVSIHVQMEDEQQVLIGVHDEGLGIPPEALPHLFERFYRAGNVSSISGTGLGLYISRQLALAHGGDLWAESPGLAKGSAFYLRLPLEQ